MSKPSLHRHIVEAIESKILSGEWPPGHRIPFELDLARLHGCSRMTVNKALAELARRGLIERRRRFGSFVTRPHAQSAVLEIRDIRQEVESLGLPYRYEIVSRRDRAATAADRRISALPAGSRLAAMTLLHFAGPQPFCLEERVINLAAVPEATGHPFADKAPGPWLVDKVPWSRAEHRIRAEGAPPRAAKLLKIDDATSCLVVERRTWSGGAFVTHARLTYPGAQHELLAEFAPASA